MLSCTGAIVAETAAPVVKTKILGLVEMVLPCGRESLIASLHLHRHIKCYSVKKTTSKMDLGTVVEMSSPSSTLLKGLYCDVSERKKQR
jgi:hypothetical protein